jgi:hypothetical protein
MDSGGNGVAPVRRTMRVFAMTFSAVLLRQHGVDDLHDETLLREAVAVCWILTTAGPTSSTAPTTAFE